MSIDMLLRRLFSLSCWRRILVPKLNDEHCGDSPEGRARVLVVPDREFLFPPPQGYISGQSFPPVRGSAQSTTVADLHTLRPLVVPTPTCCGQHHSYMAFLAKTFPTAFGWVAQRYQAAVVIPHAQAQAVASAPGDTVTVTHRICDNPSRRLRGPSCGSMGFATMT